MAIEKKSLISSTPAATSTASKLASTKNVNDKMSASGLRAAARNIHAKAVAAPINTGKSGMN